MHARAAELEKNRKRNSHHHLEDRKKKHAELENARRYKHGGRKHSKEEVAKMI